MKRPIALVVRRDSVSLFVVKGHGKVAWQARAEVTSDDARAVAIAELLAGASRIEKRRPLVALVGPAFAQVRSIVGLPDSADHAALATIIAETPRRFFAVSGTASVTSAIHRDAARRVWCSAFDRRVVDDVMRSAATARRRLSAITPLVALASSRCADGEVVYADGGTEVAARVAKGRLVSVTRRRSVTPVESHELAAAQQAIDLAASRSATMLPPLAWRPAPTGALHGHARRVGILAATLVLCAIGAAGADTAGELRAGMLARAQLARLGDGPRRIAAATAELQRTTSAIDQVERFASSRRSMSNLLRDVAQVLPDSTAITTIRVDSLGVSLTAVSPHAADVVPALTAVSGAVMPQLAGSATREQIGGARLERATFRFRFPRLASSRKPVRRPR